MEIEKEKLFQLIASGELTTLLQDCTKGRKISNSRDLYHFVLPMFAEYSQREQLFVVYYDSQLRVIAVKRESLGSIGSAAVYPREILKEIIRLGASGIALLHNHPSGECNPSQEDIALTRKIHIACTSIGCDVVEHIIAGSSDYYSFADRGHMQEISREVAQFINR